MRYENGDRVVVVKDNRPVKARVAGHNTKLGRVSVTFKKGEEPTVYMVEDVFPLYRYGATVEVADEVTGASGQITQLVPLFFVKPEEFAKKSKE